LLGVLAIGRGHLLEPRKVALGQCR
jgi:hypothetical protein